MTVLLPPLSCNVTTGNSIHSAFRKGDPNCPEYSCPHNEITGQRATGMTPHRFAYKMKGLDRITVGNGEEFQQNAVSNRGFIRATPVS